MKTEVLAAAGHEAWVIAGMICFIVAFLAVCVRVLLSDRRELERRARIPLAEEAPND
jgi:hypothetical protein